MEDAKRCQPLLTRGEDTKGFWLNAIHLDMPLENVYDTLV